MNCDKIIIRTKGVKIEIDDAELTFSLLEETYDSDGDRESEAYHIAQLVNGAEKFREECDLKTQSNWEKYRQEIASLQKSYNKLVEENKALTEKLKEFVLGEKK